MLTRFRYLTSFILIFCLAVIGSSTWFTGDDTTAGAQQEITIFLTGDAIISQTWSQYNEPEFLKLIQEIRGADVAIANLEMLINDFKGYPQTESGGTWMACKKEIASELKWAGFDMLGHANNHTYDYGSVGILESIKNIEEAGLVTAGAGKDLQSARAPAYFKHSKATIALISHTSTFTAYGRAGRSRPDMQGRPGLNPLTVTDETSITLKRSTADSLLKLARQENIPNVSLRGNTLSFLGQTYQIGEENRSIRKTIIDPKDLAGNLASIREARTKADVVVISVHTHSPGSWLNEYCHQAIDAGADIIFGHGPHRISGIELYKGKPIFYSLGDFVFQNEQIDALPSEYYEQYGLGDDAKPEDAHNIRYRGGTSGFPVQRQVWEGIAATLTLKNGQITAIKLIPVDMGFGKPVPIRGRPKYADNELGAKIITDVINLSKNYGTVIEYNASDNTGLVKIK